MTIRIRNAKPSDDRFLGRMIHLSGESINLACFGDRSSEILTTLARRPGNIFSYQWARVAELDQRPIGALFSYPGNFVNSGGPAYLVRLLLLVGPWRWAVTLTKQVLLGLALLPKKKDDYYIAYVATEPERRNVGVGSRLLKDAIKRGQNEGWRRIILDVDHDNPRALALYKRMGWVEIGRKAAPVSPRFLGTTGFTRMSLELSS